MPNWWLQVWISPSFDPWFSFLLWFVFLQRPKVLEWSTDRDKKNRGKWYRTEAQRWLTIQRDNVWIRFVEPECFHPKATTCLWLHDETFKRWCSAIIQYRRRWNTTSFDSGLSINWDIPKQQHLWISFLLQLLTGYTELELPEVRKRIKESGSVNSYPFIFYDYAHNGYATAFNEDLPNVGTFSYRLNGFHLQPTTHYMRPFYLAFQGEMNRHKKLCVGDLPRHQVMFDYTRNVRILIFANEWLRN